ncbi:non-ribosomal peptide synthetase [Marinomonas sp. MED121]|uniref:non-ribosomal peptide synthetase n=1 Tax=Marinomonas sp. MED121 TaxID=314277 RepID=UPI00031334F6|nr:non-ribosomal peptide synthetase [Marinomonas sp. MED121]
MSNLAYVIYTSGTTGKPKGVMIEQRGLLNLINSQTKAYDFNQSDIVIWLSNHIFDASVENLFLPILNGATLLIPSEDDIKDPNLIKTLLINHKVTHIHGTPSYLAALGKVDAHNEIKRVVTGGDKCPPLLQQIWGDKLINSYGPTETSITASLDLTHNQNRSPNNIGKPIDNVNFFVMDTELREVNQGYVGELYISGIALARGYLNLPELTQANFITNPSADRETGHDLLYKTGDLVKQLTDGSYEYLGRNDRQLKVRGFRIEPDEIEVQLCQIPGIEQALVRLNPYKESTSLVAYLLTPEKDTSSKHFDCEQVKIHLGKTLPEYMIPSDFVIISAWPLTLTGKIDLENLPKPVSPKRLNRYQAPITEDEKKLVSIWQGIFDMNGLGVSDDFFALGGDSITAIRFMSLLRKSMNRHLTMKDFRLNPTIEGVLVHSTFENLTGLGNQAVAAHQTEFPLSNQQMVAWYMHKSQPESKAYLAEAATHFKGQFSKDALLNAINQIVKDHDIYRTSFHEGEQGVIQKVAPHYQTQLREIHAHDVNDTDKEAFLEHTFKTELASIADLSQLPLAEFILVSFDDEHHVLLHQEHHIIHDGWSANEFTQILINQYHAFINKNYLISTDTPSQYSHFVLSQKAWLASDFASSQKSYWTKQLENAPQGVALFGNKSHTLGFAGSHEKMVFSQAQWQAMESLCSDNGITPFSYTSSILYLCLWAYSGETDLTFGSAFANRNWADSHSTLGMFVNTVVLRQQIESETSLKTFLLKTQSLVDDAQANEELPFPLVVEALNPDRNTGSNPFFNVLLGFHDTPIHTDEIEGLTWYKDETVISDTSKFDIDCLVVPRGKTFNESEEVHFLWEYREDIYSKDEIQRFLTSFKKIFLNTLEHFSHIQDAPISDIAPLSSEDTQCLLEEWGQGGEISAQTKAQFTKSNLVKALDDNAFYSPNMVAITSSEEEITYEKLVKKADILAFNLQEEGVKKGDKVAIACQRNAINIISMLAVFKLGACAVLIGADLPEQRIQYILKDSQTSCLISDGSLYQDDYQLPFIELSPYWLNKLDVERTQTRFVAPEDASSAYIIYTSGSTGQPKGIEISHKALLNMSLWHIDEFKLNSSSVGTCLAYVGFDAYMAEVWPILLAAGTVLIIKDNERDDINYLMPYLQQQGITHACLPTGLLTHACAHNIEWPDTLNTLLTGGDVLGDLSFPKGFSADFYNMYGPTETCVDACYFKADPHHLSSTPIGRPIANTVARVVLEGKLAPIGVPGELYIGGAGLALGYINNETLNSKHFIEAPSLSSATQTDHKYYRTGDLVKWRHDGQLEYIARLNDEIKIRGYRVALGEINNQIELDDSVSQAYSLVKEDAIYAYVVLSEDERARQASGESNEPKVTRQLRQLLKKSLPDYMRPNAILLLDSLPMTAQGKIDKSQLPSPVSLTTQYEVAATQTEKQLAEIWQNTLSKKQMSIKDNFFAMGGHSLLAMNIISQIRQQLHVQLNISDFFQHPSIKSQAQLIDNFIMTMAPNDKDVNSHAMEEGEI